MKSSWMPQISQSHGKVVVYPDVKTEAQKTTLTSRACLLKILSWNIAGWASRQGDPGIFDYLRLHDIIAVQETWSTDNISLNGYLVLNSYAVPSSGKSRPKAGMALMFSIAMEARVKSLPPCNKIAIYLFMAALLVIRSSAYLIINAYIPPLSSKKQITQMWNQLELYLSLIHI